MSGTQDSLISVYLEEYKVKSSEIIKHVEFQQNIVKLQVVLLSAFVGAMVHLISKGTQDMAPYILLLGIAPFRSTYF